MSKRKWTDEQFIEAVNNSLSYAQVIEKLGLKVAGSNYDTVKRKIQELNLDISHMTGKAWNQGERFHKLVLPRKLSEVLVEHSTWVNSNNLRKRLIKEGLKEYKCECCNRTEWLEKPIKLELHHINGVKDDLRIKNLQILCPNCHSQTDTYAGKSANGWSLRKYIKQSIKSNKPDEIIIGETNVSIVLGGVETSFDDFSNIVRNQIASDICQKYGITLKVLRSICKELKLELQYKKRVTKFQISKEELEELLKTTPKETIGKMFGVSGKAIAKRCISLGINTGDMRGYWMKVRANSK